MKGRATCQGVPLWTLSNDASAARAWWHLPVVDRRRARVVVAVVRELVADLDDGPVELGEPGRVDADGGDVVGPRDERAAAAGRPRAERTRVVAAVGEAPARRPSPPRAASSGLRGTSKPSGRTCGWRMENTTGAGTEQVLQRTATAQVPLVSAKPGKAPPARRRAHEVDVLLPGRNGVGVERRSRPARCSRKSVWMSAGCFPWKNPTSHLVERGLREVELVAEVVLGDLAPVDLPGTGAGDRDRHRAERGGEGENVAGAAGVGRGDRGVRDAADRLR